jgi:hypothetical protein
MPYTLRPFPKNVFGFIDFSELEKYKKAWVVFEEIYSIQVLAREDLAADGDYDLNLPYQYATFEEKMLARLGQQLHLKAYPDETWNLS